MKQRQRYPPNWEELAWQCKEEAGWCCASCGVAHGTEVISERSGVVYTVYLAAAHLDHDPWNPAPRLAALCPSCHARYDHAFRERRRWWEVERERHRWLVSAYLDGPSGERADGEEVAMELVTKTVREQLPALYAQEHEADPLVFCKFFTPDGQWTWYVLEFDGDDLFFGWVVGFDEELGYFRLSELRQARGPYGLPIERDLHFQPTRLSVVQEQRP